MVFLHRTQGSQSMVPAIWKVSHVTPLHKKGPKEFCNNYRPISLLSCSGKVLEKFIHKHVYNFLQYNIITQSQSGFIPGDSTVNQLLCIYNDLCSSFDKGINTQAVYLDIYPKHSTVCGTQACYQNWKPSASEENCLTGFGTIYHVACRLL